MSDGMTDEVITEKSAYEQLNNKQRAFVDAYIASNFNATRAARMVGYAFPNVEGPKNLVKPSIANAIKERMTFAMDANEVLQRLGNYARFDMSEFVRVPAFVAPPKDKPKEEGKEEGSDPVIDTKSVGLIEPYVDVLSLIEAGQGYAIKAIKVTPNGANIEFHDPVAALEKIGKHHKLFVERHEHTGKDGQPIEFNSTVAVAAEQELDEWRKQQLVKISNTPSV